MILKGYFCHVNPDEMDPTTRGAAAGYACHKNSDTYYPYGIAQNIFAPYRYGSILVLNGRVYESDGKSERRLQKKPWMHGWMNSQDYRENISTLA